MTTASPPSAAANVEFSTAREYQERVEPDDEQDRGEVPFAKAIVWYDQATPIFSCLSCRPHVEPLRFEGPRFDVEFYEVIRTVAYERLYSDDPDEAPRCDVCAGRLPDLVERDDE